MKIHVVANVVFFILGLSLQVHASSDQLKGCAAALLAGLPSEYNEHPDLLYKMGINQPLSPAELQALQKIEAYMLQNLSDSAQKWNESRTHQQYLVSPMVQKYVTLREINPSYIEMRLKEGLEESKVTVKDGLLYRRGVRLDTTDWTSNMMGWNENVGLYIMDGEGTLYAFPRGLVPIEDTKHSYYSRGLPVAGAGTMQVSNGKLVGSLTNWTGHYKLKTEYLFQVVDSLKRQGADMSSVSISPF